MERKKQLIRVLKQGIAEELGLKRVRIAYRKKDFFVHDMVSACFHPKTHRLSVNKSWPKIAPDEEIVRVIVHEIRHIYQFNVVLYAEHRKHDLDRATIETWKKEFQDYQLPSDNKDSLAKYQRQAIEIDAENYAIQFLKELKAMKK